MVTHLGLFTVSVHTLYVQFYELDVASVPLGGEFDDCVQGHVDVRQFICKHKTLFTTITIESSI